MHMSLHDPFELDRFPIMFRSYVLDWYYRNHRKGVNKCDHVDEDMYALYADSIEEGLDAVYALKDGDTSSVPGSVLKDMGLAITVSEVPYIAYKKSSVVFIDEKLRSNK